MDEASELAFASRSAPPARGSFWKCRLSRRSARGSDVWALVFCWRAPEAYLPVPPAIDGSVLAFTVVLVVGVVCVAGVLPAWQTSRDLVAAGLREFHGQSRRSVRLRSALVDRPGRRGPALAAFLHRPPPQTRDRDQGRPRSPHQRDHLAGDGAGAVAGIGRCRRRPCRWPSSSGPSSSVHRRSTSGVCFPASRFAWVWRPPRRSVRRTTPSTSTRSGLSEKSSWACLAADDVSRQLVSSQLHCGHEDRLRPLRCCRQVARSHRSSACHVKQRQRVRREALRRVGVPAVVVDAQFCQARL